MVKSELIGKWKWIYTINFWNPDDGQIIDNVELIVEFMNDSTLQVIRDNVLENTVNWTVVPKDGILFGLELSASVTELYGRILICDDIVEFNNSYIDGSDNYFLKIE